MSEAVGRSDRLPTVVALAAGVVGVVLLVVGWVGTSGRLTVAAQAGFVSVAVLGLVVAGAGALVFISAQSSRLAERTVRFEAACAAWIEERAR